MTIRTVLFAAAIAASLPAVSNAAGEKSSAEACASAFASNIGLVGAHAPAYKFAFHDGSSSSVMTYYRTEFKFTLEAHDPKTGAAIARATCSTDDHGNVTSITSIPLNTKSTTLAAAY